MVNLIQRYIIPGLIIQAVMAGGGYATGRELVEFYISKGPATGLVGIIITAVIFSLCAMVAFEIARKYQKFDYESFCRIFMGRYSVLFEFGYIATLLLVLSVVCAAASRMTESLIGSDKSLNAVLYIILVSCLLVGNNKYVEKIVSAWALLFYLCYGTLFVDIFIRFGGSLVEKMAISPVNLQGALYGGVTYAGCNVALIPVLIFVARNFKSRLDSLIAGALCGPLFLLPAFSFMLAITIFYPAVLQAKLPVTFLISEVHTPLLAIGIKIIILGALIKTSFGLLHGLNERVAQAIRPKYGNMPSLMRPLMAIPIMIMAIYVSARFGIIDLIRHGYRYSSAYFLLIFVAPLLTFGIWALRPSKVPLIMEDEDILIVTPET